MKIIGINGVAGSGKDTIADYLCEYPTWKRLSFAEPLKRMLEVIDEPCWTQEEKETVSEVFGVTRRYMAQTLGTDWMRDKVCRDGWVRLCEKLLRTSTQINSLSVIITDVRFDDEAEMIKKYGGRIINVTRPSGTIDVGQHKSEAGISDHLIDYKIVNDDTIESLHRKIDEILYRW